MLGKVPVLKKKLVRTWEFRNTQKHLHPNKKLWSSPKKHEHDNMYQQMNIKMMIISSTKADTLKVPLGRRGAILCNVPLQSSAEQGLSITQFTLSFKDQRQTVPERKKRKQHIFNFQKLSFGISQILYTHIWWLKLMEMNLEVWSNHQARRTPIQKHQTTGAGIVKKATYGCSLGPYLWSIVWVTWLLWPSKTTTISTK